MLTLVLLPGMDGTGLLFEGFVSALGRELEVRVIAYPSTGALGYAELESHVREALPTRGEYVVLGESFSGPIAISIAAPRPAGLVGVILCASDSVCVVRQQSSATICALPSCDWPTSNHRNTARGIECGATRALHHAVVAFRVGEGHGPGIFRRVARTTASRSVRGCFGAFEDD